MAVDELINAGQKQEALQALHDLGPSRRYIAWQKRHERIMFKILESTSFSVHGKPHEGFRCPESVMACVTPGRKDLYHLLEHEFLPLDLALKVQPLLNKIWKLGGKLSSASSVPEVQLSQYVPALEKLATLRLHQQVSQVYQTIQIVNLYKMIPFFDFVLLRRFLWMLLDIIL
ncbi:Eukaryotic translation initiation factor 3 subunit A [Datura stramonium]|uniref:Eukaryotic translation initiation factor 3 subunit A n=1 Tax=Datura stramonium TaxID=4076 RepID=A0ABS8S5E1_DATST|nr:Eukaryotic translation initiation factor 3 subunit A [Datura stramonium]